jgi:regulator of sigma E protease
VPGPRDFDGKPIWARTLVISAGVIMNMVFAFAVYSFVAGFWGIRDVASTKVGVVLAQYLPEGSEGMAQLPVGSEITRVGDEGVEKWGDVGLALVHADAGPLTIGHRNPTGTVEVRVPSSEEDRVRLAMTVQRWIDAAVGRVEPGSPAERGGIERGDRILSIDGTPIVNWYDFLDAVHARPGARAEVRLMREGRELTRVVNLESQNVDDPITGDPVTQGRIGIYVPGDDFVYTRVGLTEALAVGYRETVAVTGMILDFLKNLVTGGVSPRSVGSIVTIGEMSGEAAGMGVEFFLSFMALFSVNLAILNLLPIPVLDGGHLVFLAIEALRGGRPLSVEQRMKWSQAGFVVLLGIMVWALSNDFLRLFGM